LMAEAYLRGTEPDKVQLAEILKPFIDAAANDALDQLALGCTHFPILKAHIQQLLPTVTVVDSSDAIGKQTQRIITHLDLEQTGTSQQHFFMTIDDYQLHNNPNIEQGSTSILEI